MRKNFYPIMVVLVSSMLLFGTVSCKDDRYADGLEMSLENDTNIRADNYSIITVRATMVYPDAPNKKPEYLYMLNDSEKVPFQDNIELTTNSGVFVESNGKNLKLKPDNQNSVTGHLRVGNQVEPILLQAKAGEYITSKTITPLRAYPDNIIVQSDKGVVTVGDSSNITIKAIVKRELGEVSVNTRFIFNALQNGVSVGNFTDLENTFKEASSDTVSAEFITDSSTDTDITIGTDIDFTVKTTTDLGDTKSYMLTIPTKSI